MRKIVAFMHVSLDGFVGRTDGALDWIHVDEQLFDFAGAETDKSDTALYGRVTWQMMDAYWPTAADEPGASKHDRQHAGWYNRVEKLVLSKSLQGQDQGLTKFVGDDAEQTIESAKHKDGGNIIIFGSPSAVRFLEEKNLLDEYWLFLNPVLLGDGIPLFSNSPNTTELELLENVSFSGGVVGLHYQRKRKTD